MKCSFTLRPAQIGAEVDNLQLGIYS